MKVKPLKLSPAKKEKLRHDWESAPQRGFTWLVKKYKLKTNATELKKLAEEEEWIKENKKTSVLMLTPRQKKFLELYGQVSDKKAKQLAGYSENTESAVIKQQLLAELKEKVNGQYSIVGADREQIIKFLTALVFFDVNQIAQIRRGACPYCWSDDNRPLKTLDQYNKEVEAIEKYNLTKSPEERLPLPKEPKRFYDFTAPPNSECPNCHGEGAERTWLADTRTLDPIARLVYKGWKMTNAGPEVMVIDKEKAWDMLCKALKVFDGDVNNVQINNIYTEQMADKFDSIMRASEERQIKLEKEREILLAEADAKVHGREV